ncbi:reverse transcriptase domain-containing protein [Trichonephila clavipes]|nr:reverse transcriptase domain-containing protein [Trichonephila clavipes]
MLIVRQHIRTSGNYGESFADIPLRRISWHSQRQKQMLAEYGVGVGGNPGCDMCPHSFRQRPVNNYGKKLRLQTGYIGNFPSLFYKPRTLSFLPQKKLLTFWQSLKEHCFPSSWREAIVIPILKPGKVATDPLSYRPIALTSCFSVRYFNVRIGHSFSHKFIQDQGVPQGSVLSVTLFNIHMSNILHQLPPSVRGMLYVDDLQVSCQGSDMRLIERQLQTTVNRLVQWCD